MDTSSPRVHCYICVHSWCWIIYVLWSVTESCPALCDAMGCSLQGSSVHGILQARTLEWVAMPCSKGSSQPRDQILVLRCRQILYFWATGEALCNLRAVLTLCDPMDCSPPGYQFEHMYNDMYPPLWYHSEKSHCPKNPLLGLFTLIPGDCWPSYRLYHFVFSRTS